MRFILYLSSLLVFLAAPAVAQNAMPACSGELVIVRLSTIKPTGTMKGFMDAVAAHQAWYRNNGVMDDEIVAARIVVKDEKTGANKYSDTEVLTYHFNPPGGQRTPHRGDAAWNSYVKMYNDNADITKEYLTCMPKHEKM